jgi:hypothetical protein
MKIASAAAALLLLLGLSACDDDVAAPPAATALEQARAKWQQSGFDSYEITQRRNCYCMLGGQPVRLLVFRDSLVSGMNLADSTALSVEQLGWYKSIDQLFEFLGTVDPAKVASFEASYDSTFGFPAHFWIDYDTQIADEEIGYECSDLHPLR